MKKTLSFLTLTLFAAGLATAPVYAGEPTDLGNNLSYLRVHALAGSDPALQVALSAQHACVLDVRYATATEESIATFRTALAKHPSEAPLFILISPATPPSVVDAVNAVTPATFVTLGIAGSNPSPKITVKTTAATDREAYDAFDNGTSLTELISGKIEKDRFDEATLVKEFKSGNPDPEAPSATDRAATKPPETPTKAAVLTDRVLQRALHLHQALLALQRSI